MKLAAFFAGIFMTIASWFGAKTPAVQTAPKTDAPMVAVTSASDEDAVKSVALAAIGAERKAATFQDVQNFASKYYSAATLTKFHATIDSLPAASRKTLEDEIISFAQQMPDPSSLKFSITINGNSALAISSFPDSSETSSGMTVTTSGNKVTVALRKESGQWKIDSINLNSNGTLTR